MVDRTPTEVTNLDRYGNAALEWDRANEALAAGPENRTSFLGTTGPDGRPHAQGVGAAWLGGELCLAAHYRELGWPAEVEGDAFTAPFSAPSGGPPPWHLYVINYRTIFGVAGAEPHGATRWRFED